MKGYIRQLSDRSWQITADIGPGPGGQRRRHFETVRGRKTDAQRRLNALLAEIDKGGFTSPGRMMVKDLLHEWLNGYVKTNCSPRTLDGYRSIVDAHLIPHLGYVQLKALRPQMIQAYYSTALDHGLSSRTVHHHHRVISQALKYAVRQGYLGRNPCELVDPPSPRGKAMRTLTPGEVEVLLLMAGDNPYYPIIYTALNSGLRQAELLGLRWRDVDVVSASLSVSQVLYKRGGQCILKDPKTSHSRRRVSMTRKLARFLEAYYAQRQDLYRELGVELTPDSLVFAHPDESALDPSVVTHGFGKVAARAGLQGVRFHDLRHTFASLMLLRGAKPKVISEALGHSSVAFTMDTYSHIIDGMQQDAMALLDEVMPEGQESISVASQKCRNFAES